MELDPAGAGVAQALCGNTGWGVLHDCFMPGLSAARPRITFSRQLLTQLPLLAPWPWHCRLPGDCLAHLGFGWVLLGPAPGCCFTGSFLALPEVRSMPLAQAQQGWQHGCCQCDSAHPAGAATA